MPDASDLPPWATPEWLAWLRQIVAANLYRYLRQRPPDQPPPKDPGSGVA